VLGRCVRASSSLLELAAGFDLPFRSPWEGTVASITPSMRSHMMQIYASLEIRGSLWRISFLFYIYISIFKLTGKPLPTLVLLFLLLLFKNSSRLSSSLARCQHAVILRDINTAQIKIQ